MASSSEIAMPAAATMVLKKAVILKDPITGLPVLSAGKGAPKLTNEQVRELLADFP